MTLSERHIIKKTHPLFAETDRVCLLSKNLYNAANYVVRNEFIRSTELKKEGLVGHATYLNYHVIRKLFINHPDYVALPRKVSNQTLMKLDENWRGFFTKIKDWKTNPNKYTGMPNFPGFKNTTTGRFLTVYELGSISKTQLRNGIVKLSQAEISIETEKVGVRECRVVPVGNHYVIEVAYKVPDVTPLPSVGRCAAIDLGVNNLATVGSNVIKPFVLNGRPLKSINHFYNQELAEMQSKLPKPTPEEWEEFHKEKKKPKNERKINKKTRLTTNQIQALTAKRKNKIEDYMHKASSYIINQLVSNAIDTLVIGYNQGWKQEINIGKKNNQNFTYIPHAKFVNMLTYKAKLVGITVIPQNEAYTSKCSFLDGEEVCKHEKYLGKRIKRGLFKSNKGILINADLNGAYNILIKAVPNAFKGNEIKALAVSPSVVTVK